ncbi:HlyC/CorC family transporter [Sessilibacter corallicola]|uniref:Magnesium and cobalt efflux protein CorC n=1 Tax=Sessilibacter corallicola TaxID=2904075 RepID=A0ABQ0A776_9GAMM|nr:transporter associated domain-containing protein [Sessilibacter corallicola]MCE2028521.1 CBS domain-containing protein [Sessilibacter corallicola]
MSEDSSSSRLSSRGQDKSWLDKLMSSFSAEPKSREDLLNIIKEAAANQLLDDEAVGMIEGAIDVQERQVREVMIPRSQMVVIKADEGPSDFLPTIIESAHSRFPVVGDSMDDIKGILLAKDLLPLILNGTDGFSLDHIIRPASIIPESKRLNVLLREFRENRYHMALVIDEYGAIAGLVTIEDVLEKIVGEIEDETDEDDDGYVRKVSDSEYVIKALMPIEEFNEEFEAGFDESEVDTIGGILIRAFGHLPTRNEVTEIDNHIFRVLYADSRQIHLIRLTLPE